MTHTEHELYLLDDGTMDTVISCVHCGKTWRFSAEFAGPYRDNAGILDESAFLAVALDEIDEYCTVNTDVQRIVSQMIDSKYNPDDGTVTIVLSLDDANTVIDILDNYHEDTEE